MFLKQALNAITEAAQHPLAIGMYVLLIASWTLISLRVKRFRILLRHLKKIPEIDRLKVIELELGPKPITIDPITWLSSQTLKYRIVRFAISCLTMIIIITLVVYYYLHTGPSILPVSGNVLLDGSPLQSAIISINGLQGQWTSNKNGAFYFQIPDLINSDSITMTISHSNNNENIHRDFTIASSKTEALCFKLSSIKTCMISGHIFESKTGKTIANAKILLLDNKGEGITNKIGYFYFRAFGKPYESVQANISHIDFEPTTVGLTLSKDNRILLKRKQ